MIKQIHIPSRLMLEALEDELKSIETSHHTFDERGRLKSKIAFLEEKIYSAEAFLDVCLEQGFSVKASCAFQDGVMMLVLHKPDDSCGGG